MAKKVLFIVEGLSDEVRFVKQLFIVCYKKTDYQIFSYKTNIHTLSKKLIECYPDFENDEVEIKQVLLSLVQDKHSREILMKNYTDIYMIFDFEPQHDFPHFDIVKRMIDYFQDPTVEGKLYINYPMMQSYKHFHELPDDAFMTKIVALDSIRTYKKDVGEQSSYTDVSKYTYDIFYSLCIHHMKKAYYLISGKYEIPSIEEFYKWNESSIFDKQILQKNTFNQIFILNTCIFILPAYAPNKFYTFINKHKEDLKI